MIQSKLNFFPQPKSPSTDITSNLSYTFQSTNVPPNSYNLVSQQTGYWMKYTKEVSKKLSLPLKINEEEKKKFIFMNDSLKRLGRNCWFTTQALKPKYQVKISSRTKEFLWKEISECAQRKLAEDEEKKEREDKKKRKGPGMLKRMRLKKNEGKQEITESEERKTKKIRLFPTEDQRNKLKQWFGTARWTYNQCLASIKEKKSKLNMKQLRSQFINNDSAIVQEKTWIKNTPYEIRDQAMHDLIKAFESNKAKGPEHKFDLKFKSKKRDKDSIAILKKGWKGVGVMFPTFFGSTSIKSSEPLPRELPFDSRLIKTRLNEYYICIPEPIEIRPKSQGPKNQVKGEVKVISMDPGVRTFNTGYDLNGYSYEWGKADNKRLFRLCYAHDRLQSKWSQPDVRHKKRYKLQRAARRIRRRIRNLVNDVHCRLAKWLCENFNIILLPDFNTQRMVSRYDRKIGSKTARR